MFPTPEHIQQLNRILRLEVPANLNTLDQYASPILPPLHSNSSFEDVELFRNRTIPEYSTSQSWPGKNETT